jgi:hypoxanthine-guanine phosphoribosyltransferase
MLTKGDQSSGKVAVVGGDDLEELRGKNVLVVEDIIDTGRTMRKLLATLADHEPKKVRVVRLGCISAFIKVKVIQLYQFDFVVLNKNFSFF